MSINTKRSTDAEKHSSRDIEALKLIRRYMTCLAEQIRDQDTYIARTMERARSCVAYGMSMDAVMLVDCIVRAEYGKRELLKRMLDYDRSYLPSTDADETGTFSENFEQLLERLADERLAAARAEYRERAIAQNSLHEGRVEGLLGELKAEARAKVRKFGGLTGRETVGRRDHAAKLRAEKSAEEVRE